MGRPCFHRVRFAAFFWLAAVAAPGALAGEAWDAAARTGELRWGADATGGAPYIYPDPERPGRLVGFEVDVMDALGRRLGLKPKVVQVPWDELVPALLRGDFDVAFNGLEVTPARRAAIDFTHPYYIFSEQITVRRGETGIRAFEGLRGRRVGTLSASLAQTMMEEDGRITVVTYPSPVESYKDLELGRLDAVLLDVPIAAWYAGSNPKLENAGEPVGEGFYAGGVRKDSPLLRERLDAAIAETIASGELEGIYRRWNIWTPANARLAEKAAERGASFGGKAPLTKYIPLLLKGAAVTVQISILAMVLAVVLGLALCLGRLYGGPAGANLCAIYVEIVRGTPLLIQLYLLYYGLPNLGIQLHALAAAVLGMGMNYAAYESEIYRAGLLSIPRGQEEAARSLGLTRAQTLRYVLLPQAARTILPPSTNDFIALFKDTSLVSIITVAELTRSYSLAATATFRFLELGLLTAVLYFAMSYPLSLWSRRLERERHAAVH
jgi:polar amino acid transport system substrate-binding protein